MTYATFNTRSSCCNVGAASRRITREEVASLRTVAVREASTGRKAVEAISSCVQGLVAFVSSPIKAERKTGMCHNYGHVIKSTKWEGAYPKCGDCGVNITSPSMLRKAMPVK